jgi:serine protease Do
MKLPRRLLSFAVSLWAFGFISAPLIAAPESAPLVKDLADLKQLDQALVAMADRTAAATVSLISTQGKGAGSGVIVDDSGTILTAAHVLSALSGDIIVLFSDGKRAAAKALGADFDRDAAMIQITDAGEYPSVELAEPEPLPLNSWCVALGHPGGYDPLRTPPMRLGRVLHYADFLITDCTVVGGDSGGPLFDTAGRVIGIHSNIGSTLSENRHVPIKVYRDQWDELQAGKRSGSRFDQQAKAKAKPDQAPPKSASPPKQPELGLKFGKEGPDGVAIEEVAKDSLAAKAGLLAGDVIVKVARKNVTTAKECAEALAKPGRRPNVMLTYRRGSEEMRARIPVQSKPEQAKESEKTSAQETEINEFIDKYLAQQKAGNMQIKLTPEQLEKFGGMENFQKHLAERIKKLHPEMKNFRMEQRKEPASGTGADADKTTDKLVQELRERAKSNGGRLQVTPEEIKQLGGMEKAQELLKLPEMSDDFFKSVLAALKPVVQGASAYTANVLADGKDVALGTVVSENGGILTKNSETTKGVISVRIGDKTYPASLVRRFADWDLALFHIEVGGLRPVDLKPSGKSPARGSLLTVPGPGDDSLGIGMVSVNSRPLGQIGYLGVQAQTDSKTVGGAVAKVVLKDGPADKAGLKEGDLILSLNGQPIPNAQAFTETITKLRVNDVVKIEVQRDGKKEMLEAKLGERPQPKMGPDFLKMNQMSGPLSPKTTGFPLALQHDIPLEPGQCGGPLFDLDGRCIGINVARAGRVSSLAIPTAKIADLLADCRDDLAKLSAGTKPPAAASAEDLARLTQMLAEIQRSLRAIEKRLDAAEKRPAEEKP